MSILSTVLVLLGVLVMTTLALGPALLETLPDHEPTPVRPATPSATPRLPRPALAA